VFANNKKRQAELRAPITASKIRIIGGTPSNENKISRRWQERALLSFHPSACRKGTSGSLHRPVKMFMTAAFAP
jgi:hypothetical protein